MNIKRGDGEREAGIGLAWLSPWIAYALYVAVALSWFVPDRRLAVEASH
jgi:hypothetical protein